MDKSYWNWIRQQANELKRMVDPDNDPDQEASKLIYNSGWFIEETEETKNDLFDALVGLLQ